MNNIKVLGITLLSLCSSAYSYADAAYCFTRGPEGADSYTRNWSDAQNWDSQGIIVYAGNAWNTSGNTTLVPGEGDSVYFNAFSGYNGNDGGSIMNLDVDATIKYFSQNDVNGVVQKLSSDSGKSLTLSNVNGGTAIDKWRCLNTMTFDVNVILAQTADKTMTISMKSDKDLIFNKDIVYKQLSGEPSQWGRSMRFLVNYRGATEWTKMVSGNIVINGNICNYDADGNPTKLTKGINVAADKKLSAANAETEAVGKVVFQGAGYTMGGMQLTNGIVVDFARDNKGAATFAGEAIEIYNSSTINFVKSNQLAANTSIQFKAADGDRYAGTLNMMGNTVDNISYLYFSDFTNNKGLAKIDFGENTTDQWFVFSDMRTTSTITTDVVWGIDVFNFETDKDHIRFLNLDDVKIATAKDHIYFSALGEKGVDYNVVANLVNGYYEFTYELIPEPADFAAIGALLALGLAAYRRKRN